MNKKINANEAEKPKFDLKSLRVSQDLEPATKPAFGHVHLGKHSKRCFFRTFLIPERSERFWLVEDLEGELYLATPKLALELGADTYPVCLMPFVTRDPTVGLWPIKTGKPGAKPNSWNESAFRAALVAKEKWTRLQSNQTLSGHTKPLQRFCVVLGNTQALVVHEAEVVLGGCVTLFGKRQKLS